MKYKCPECGKKLKSKQLICKCRLYCKECNTFFNVSYVRGYWKGYKAGKDRIATPKGEQYGL